MTRKRRTMPNPWLDEGPFHERAEEMARAFAPAIRKCIRLGLSEAEDQSAGNASGLRQLVESGIHQWSISIECRPKPERYVIEFGVCGTTETPEPIAKWVFHSRRDGAAWDMGPAS